MVDSPIIPLARIQKTHSFPKKVNESSPPRQSYRAELFHKGGGVFEGKKEVYLRSDDSKPWQKILLATEPKPLGSGWGKATGLILCFESHENFKSFEVGLARSSFPKLNGEVYLCDLIGAEVIDEQGKNFGQVKGFIELNSQFLNTMNVEVEGSDGSFEFPFEWIDLKSSHLDSSAPKKCIVPNCEVWKKLK